MAAVDRMKVRLTINSRMSSALRSRPVNSTTVILQARRLTVTFRGMYLANFVSDIAIFVLKRDVKLQLTNYS